MSRQQNVGTLEVEKAGDREERVFGVSWSKRDNGKDRVKNDQRGEQVGMWHARGT
jgi:hypothetical protein